MAGKLDATRLDGLDGIFDPPEKKAVAAKISNPMEKRMGEINAFYEANGREPREHGDGSEYDLACSLAGFRASKDKIAALTSADVHGLLHQVSASAKPRTLEEVLASDDPLFSDPYGLDSKPVEIDPGLLARTEERNGLTRRVTGEITERRPCEVFGVWRSAFAKLREDVNTGRRKLFLTNATNQVSKGDSFVLDGQICTVAEVLDVLDETGLPRKRLRVVIDNGTEYEPYLESFGKALWRDPNARRIAEPDGRVDTNGLFGAAAARTGYIYAARTLGPAPEGLAGSIIKIGRTKGDPTRRLAGAADDPTFLRQPAQLVRQWELVGYEPKDVEAALHAFFADAAIEQEMIDGFGRTVRIREWFQLTAELVDQAIRLMLERRINEHRYDAKVSRILTR